MAAPVAAVLRVNERINCLSPNAVIVNNISVRRLYLVAENDQTFILPGQEVMIFPSETLRFPGGEEFLLIWEDDYLEEGLDIIDA